MTPQASRHARSSGRSAGSGTTWLRSTTTASAKPAVFMPCISGAPAASRSGLGSASQAWSQEVGSPPAQAGQAPQARISVTSTGSPGARPRDARPERGDMAGGLVAVDRGQRAAPGAVGIGEVGMADRAGGDPHRDLARARRVERDLLDPERLPEGPADGGAHRLTPVSPADLPRAGYQIEGAWTRTCTSRAPAHIRRCLRQRGGRHATPLATAILSRRSSRRPAAGRRPGAGRPDAGAGRARSIRG